MILRLLTWLRTLARKRKQPRTFVFGDKKIAVLEGKLGGEHAVIIVERDDPYLAKFLESCDGSTPVTGDITKFKDPVVLKFPTEGQVAVVTQALIRTYV